MMGRGAMRHMMHSGIGMKGHREGHGMHEHYRKLVGRIDLLEARMAKIEILLERLIQRCGIRRSLSLVAPCDGRPT
jgi:hypothetical protein